MPSNFEAAKKKFLERIGNKTWTELADDREKEIDAQVAKLQTPEYIENFGKPKADAEGK